MRKSSARQREYVEGMGWSLAEVYREDDNLFTGKREGRSNMRKRSSTRLDRRSAARETDSTSSLFYVYDTRLARRFHRRRTMLEVE